MENSFVKHPAVPTNVPLSVPGSREEAQAIQAYLRARLDNWVAKFGPLPPREPVKLSIHSERKWSWFDGFLEQYVTYSGEPGERIPAYLLIPNRGKSPFPAVVAHHQCNLDCDVGKEAVVGKAYLRPDQAYGFELVNRGYVVLVPDSINCGERNIKGLREQEVRDKSKCWGAVIKYLSVKSFRLKHLYDSLRAVDVLGSLDFVDSNRIGMIGHSLGAGATFMSMAYDSRVKAGITSSVLAVGLSDSGRTGHLQFYRSKSPGIYKHEMLGMIPPRGLLATKGDEEHPLTNLGDLRSPEEAISVLKWAFDYSKIFCRLYGVSDDQMQVRVYNGVHEFPQSEREYAYN